MSNHREQMLSRVEELERHLQTVRSREGHRDLMSLLQKLHGSQPYVCLRDERRWVNGERDSQQGDRPAWSSLLRRSYFGNGSREYPMGGCHNCGGGACTKNTRDPADGALAAA